MTIAFPNSARSYDETSRRIRFQGYDGMFEVRFYVEVDVLTTKASPIVTSEGDVLLAFDEFRTVILDVAKRIYDSMKKNSIVLKLEDFD